MILENYFDNASCSYYKDLKVPSHINFSSSTFRKALGNAAADSLLPTVTHLKRYRGHLKRYTHLMNGPQKSLEYPLRLVWDQLPLMI